MTELSTLEKSRFLGSVQKDTTKVEIAQMDTVSKLTKMLQALADQSLLQGEKMALVSEIAGYVQIATLFLGPLLVVGGVLATGGALTSLLSEAAITGVESSAQLSQGLLGGTQGVLEATSSQKRASIQKDKVATTILQQNMDDTLNSLENQKEMAQRNTEGALKVLNNDVKIARQKL